MADLSERFPMTIELSFEVEAWQNKSGLTDQQLANYVVAACIDERNELVREAKILLLRALDGDFEDAGLPGLAQVPGAQAPLARGQATGTNGTDEVQVGRFARFGGLVRANGRRVGSWITGG